MAIVYQVKKTTKFRDDVAAAAEGLTKNIFGLDRAAKEIGISKGYIGNIAKGRYTPIEENIGLSVDILRKFNYKRCNKYNYLAAVVPINFGKVPKGYELQLCEVAIQRANIDGLDNITRASMFYAECYEPQKGLGISALDYWREELFCDEGTSHLSKLSGLSVVTMRRAINRKISPRLKTVQKILRPYRKKLVILKMRSENGLPTVHYGDEIILKY